MKTAFKCVLVLLAAFLVLVAVGPAAGGPEVLILFALALAAMVVIVRRERRNA